MGGNNQHHMPTGSPDGRPPMGGNNQQHHMPTGSPDGRPPMGGNNQQHHMPTGSPEGHPHNQNHMSPNSRPPMNGNNKPHMPTGQPINQKPVPIKADDLLEKSEQKEMLTGSQAGSNQHKLQSNLAQSGGSFHLTAASFMVALVAILATLIF